MTKRIEVEVVFARPDKQVLLPVALRADATVADALAESGLRQQFPETDFDRLSSGIWGRLVPREHPLADGDRVEFYRPLELDPKDARRQLALLGRTMSDGATD